MKRRKYLTLEQKKFLICHHPKIINFLMNEIDKNQYKNFIKYIGADPSFSFSEYLIKKLEETGFHITPKHFRNFCRKYYEGNKGYSDLNRYPIKVGYRYWINCIEKKYLWKKITQQKF